MSLILININLALTIFLLFLEIRSLKRLLRWKEERNNLRNEIQELKFRLNGVEYREKCRAAGLKVVWSWDKESEFEEESLDT